MSTIRPHVAALCFFVLCAIARAGDVDWPQWSGLDRGGVTSEPSGHPKAWPPNKLWLKNVGHGCTSPIVKELGRVDNVVRDVCYPHVVLSHGLIVCKDKSGNTVVLSVQE